ncbi:protein bag-of-marbles [Drosophila subpulchrella]|uniref:protein bag-of-marbles n=1 Tax=Drosophila subpulchrella TaxID=1486046 RepID=UPI0018A1479B|nr:protein bag-of-marbles [Drosophila subpulchrella]
MFNARAMDVGPSANDDQQLFRNLMEVQQELSCLLESNENLAESRAAASLELQDSDNDVSSSTSGVLSEIQHNFRVLRLDNSAPRFEFHGWGCLQQLQKRSRQFGYCGAPAKKSRSGEAACFMVTGPKQEQLQKENVWNQQRHEEVNSSPMSVASLRSIGLHGDCLEHNPVLRVMDLFRSLHDHLTADLGFSRQNSMPSDYLFDAPFKNSMPKSLNVRYQLQVLCSKTDRFLIKQRRILETNRSFDYEKYSECDKLIKGSTSYLQSFNQFMNVEMRHRNGNFITQSAKFNVQRLESLLIGLREWLKATHLSVHVFNWEMDLEHRYSAAMTESHKSLQERAILLAGAELQAAKPRGITVEELYIAKRYKLERVMTCAIEQDEFLTALLAHPETYFPPQVVAICGPPKVVVDMEDSEEVEEYEDDAPSSPPRSNDRTFFRFRS